MLHVAAGTVVAVVVANALAPFRPGFETEQVTTASLWCRVDCACGVECVVEAALKLERYGWRSYLARGWKRFDGTVVRVSLLMPVTPHDLGAFAALLALRLVRLSRRFRLVAFIRQP